MNPFGVGVLTLSGGEVRAINTASVLGNSSFIINGNVIISGSQNLTFANTGLFQTGGILNNNGSGALTLAAALDGPGDIEQNTGTLILGGDNDDFDGTINFNGGTLSLTNNDALGSATVGVNDGTVFDLNGVTFANAINLNGGILSITGSTTLNGALNLATNGSATILMNAGADLTLNQAINGGGNLSLQGTGPITVNASLGAVTPLASVLANTNLNLSDIQIVTTGTQAYNSGLTLLGNASLRSDGNISLSGVNGAKNLSIQSGGTTTLANNIGAGTALENLQVAANQININAANINTSGAQSYVATGAINVGANTQVQATQTTFNGQLALNNFSVNVQGNGASNSLAVNSGQAQSWDINSANAATLTFSNILGNIVASNIQQFSGGALADEFNISGNGAVASIDGGNGSNTLTVANNNVTQVWNVTDANTGNVTNVVGAFSNVQNLRGGMSDDEFYMHAQAQATSIQGGGGNNTLVAANNTNNQWEVSGTNAGSLQNILTAFSQIQNLTGGTASDRFNINGNLAGNINANSGDDAIALGTGTIGGALNGGDGMDSLTAASNMSNLWTLTGADTGTVTGIGAGFSSIENLTGGNLGNTFVFQTGSSLSGFLNGGSLNGGSVMNTLDYVNYGPQMTLVMTSLNGGYANAGTDWASSNHMLNFGNINNLVAAEGADNTIVFPSAKSNAIVFTGPRQGYFNDPTFFTGFTSYRSTNSGDTVQFNVPASFSGNSVTINGVSMTFYGFTFDTGGGTTPSLNVASIIQQPEINGNSDDSNSESPEWIIIRDTLNQNLNEIADAAKKAFDTNLDKVKINPYCTAASASL